MNFPNNRENNDLFKSKRIFIDRDINSEKKSKNKFVFKILNKTFCFRNRKLI